MCYNVKKMCRKSSPSGEGKGEGPAGEGGGATIFLNPVCSVHLCSSVRDRTHPPYEMRRM